MSPDNTNRNMPSRTSSRVQPLVVLVVAFAAGIAVDRYRAVPMSAWMAMAGVGLVGWMLAFRSRRTRLAAILLLVVASAVGAARHHDYWYLFDADEIGRTASDRAQPVCLEAVALTSPARIPAPPPNPMQSIPVGERSVLTVRLTRVRNGERWQAATGDAELSVDGHLLGVVAGDLIRVLGKYRKPTTQENPAEFDVAAQRRTERQLIQLNAHFPDAVRVVSRGSMWNGRRVVASVRSHCQSHLWDHLRRRQAALASAVLLGAREQLDWERTQAFVTTGTVHLLAISGLHVGILAYGFWWVARLFPLGRRQTVLAAAAFVVLYAVLTASRPPVLRATILIVAFCLARLSGRRTAGYNVLAAAALLLLLWNPTNLFQPGAQLSFLAVATVFLFSPYLTPAGTSDPLDKLIIQSRPWFVRLYRHTRESVRVVFTVSATIWLAALPLVMYRYHLFSPIAVVLNPIVWIPIAAALLSGFCELLFGWLLPPLAQMSGWMCNGCLGLVEALVEYAAGLTWGHYWTPGPPLWWILGFYGGSLLYFTFLRSRIPTRWYGASLVLWIAVWMASCDRHGNWLSRSQQPPLACTFLAVGHGGCAVLELPQGQTVLYDAGRMGLPGRANRAISSFLWSRGIRHLDAVVLSHADADHYNALPDLLNRFSVGVVFVSPVMFLAEDEAVATLQQRVRDQGIPIREVYGGDRFQLQGAARIQVLHPLRQSVPGGDNANSLVLRMDYAGRTILLPADLEGQGLEDVLAEQKIDCDVLLAPHHGSIRSRPADMAAWCSPEWVVISGANEDGGPLPEQAFARTGARVLHTARSGAVRVSIDEGQIEVRAWREHPW